MIATLEKHYPPLGWWCDLRGLADWLFPSCVGGIKLLFYFDLSVPQELKDFLVLDVLGLSWGDLLQWLSRCNGLEAGLKPPHLAL